MQTIDYLDMIKEKYECSDYKASKLLNLSTASTSRYRNKKATFDDVTALRAAELLEIDSALILTNMQIERAKNQEVRKAWEKVWALAERHTRALPKKAVSSLVIIGAIGMTSIPNLPSSNQVFDITQNYAK